MLWLFCFRATADCSDDDSEPNNNVTAEPPKITITDPAGQETSSSSAAKAPKRPRKTTMERAEQRVMATAENEQARAELEAAGTHVHDFATGYSTIVTDRKSE